jgi:hypothetical protein
MVNAIAAAGSGYVPPAYNAMRTTLLDDLKTSTGSELRLFDLRWSRNQLGCWCYCCCLLLAWV